MTIVFNPLGDRNRRRQPQRVLTHYFRGMYHLAGVNGPRGGKRTACGQGVDGRRRVYTDLMAYWMRTETYGRCNACKSVAGW